jgi:ElaB/YqjD/DUF883 family membrane-anchored ribosome-binding protein
MDRRLPLEVMMNGKNGQEQIEAAAEEAAGVIAETAGKVKSAATEVGNTAQEYVREAGRQAGAVAQTAYSQGSDLIDTVDGFVRDNAWGSVLIAAAVGYGLACLVKNSR